ncbi:MAG TPA: hypothetical protein VKX17_27545, partial [Planctomycetota bacterium]|nr:hypothetical protein [Planctomycetota bacterium]
ERKTSDFCSDRGANFMRYPKEITLEVRNEEPDKKRRFTPRSLFKHPLREYLIILRQFYDNT